MAGSGLRSLNGAFGALSISATASKSNGALSLAMGRSRLLGEASKRAISARTMATEAKHAQAPSSSSSLITTVPVTIHSFPSLEPVSLEQWSTKHLHLPLRRDLLHLAVVFEGDNTRQGTASSKTRWDVAGSHRKVRPQKGTGSSRLGTRQSPLIRGGGKSFGPHPRDFGTSMNRKVYDKAWRTALSYRYRRGQLVVCEDGMDLPLPEDYFQLVETGYMTEELATGYLRKVAEQMLQTHEWTRDFGRTLFVTSEPGGTLFDAMAAAGEHGRALDVEDVDVKDLLEEGRVVIERGALQKMIEDHQSDLASPLAADARTAGLPVGQRVLG